MFMFKEMERVLTITICLSCLFLARSQTIDITTLGAKSGSDIGSALLKAWGTACSSTTPAKIVVPKGTYALKEVVLQGPCKAPIELQVSGTVQGPADPSAITKDNEWITVEHVEHFTLSGDGIFDGQGAAKAWKQSDQCASAASCNKLADNFAFNFINHSTITGITSKNSKLFHMLVLGCQNLTISRVTIDAPALSPNTDGVHVGRSTGVTIADSTIKTGDDCVSIGDGSKQVTVIGVTCGPGHGISVGSLGKYEKEAPVEGIFVKDCTLINTDNGVRIKTWAASLPLTATDIYYENIKMQNVSNPILIDQQYCPSPPCKADPPSKVQISKVSYKGITGTSATPQIVKLICSESNPCQGVEIGYINLAYAGPKTVGFQSAGPKQSATTNCSNVQPSFVGTQIPKVCA